MTHARRFLATAATLEHACKAAADRAVQWQCTGAASVDGAGSSTDASGVAPATLTAGDTPGTAQLSAASTVRYYAHTVGVNGVVEHGPEVVKTAQASRQVSIVDAPPLELELFDDTLKPGDSTTLWIQILYYAAPFEADIELSVSGRGTLSEDSLHLASQSPSAGVTLTAADQCGGVTISAVAEISVPAAASDSQHCRIEQSLAAEVYLRPIQRWTATYTLAFASIDSLEPPDPYYSSNRYSPWFEGTATGVCTFTVDLNAAPFDTSIRGAGTLTFSATPHDGEVKDKGDGTCHDVYGFFDLRDVELEVLGEAFASYPSGEPVITLLHLGRADKPVFLRTKTSETCTSIEGSYVVDSSTIERLFFGGEVYGPNASPIPLREGESAAGRWYSWCGDEYYGSSLNGDYTFTLETMTETQP